MYCERIKAMREDRDLTQQRVADYLKISRSAYSGYENCAHEMPISTLIELANFYKVSVDYLLGLTDNPKRNI